MSKILLLPLGTTGDLLPMIWIGRQMSVRGHQVTLLWLANYRELVEQAGLELAAQILFCKSGDQVWDGSAEFMLR